MLESVLAYVLFIAAILGIGYVFNPYPDYTPTRKKKKVPLPDLRLSELSREEQIVMIQRVHVEEIKRKMREQDEIHKRLYMQVWERKQQEKVEAWKRGEPI